MGESFTVDSERSKEAYKSYVDDCWEKDKYLTFVPPRIGKDRSLTQGDLFHVWLRTWIAHLLEKSAKEVTKAELAGIKKTFKASFYRQSGYTWLVHDVTDYSTGDRTVDFTSSGHWGRGEMYMALERMQLVAGKQGCILESRGAFGKMQREVNG